MKAKTHASRRTTVKTARGKRRRAETAMKTIAMRAKRS